MSNASGIIAGKAFVELSADDSKMRAALDRASTYFETWGQTMTASGAKLIALGAGLAAPFIAAANAFGSMGSEMALASNRTGVTVEQLSQLKYAASQAGVSFEDLEGSLLKMSRTVSGLSPSSGRAEKALTDIGVSMAQLQQLNPEQQFMKLADAISKVQSPTERAAAAMAIFGGHGGGAGAALIPLMLQGADGIGKLMNQANNLGLTMSTTDAFAALEFSQRLKDLWAIVGMGSFRLGAELAPALNVAVNLFIAANEAVSDFANAHKKAFEIIAGGTAALAIGSIAAGASLIIFGQAMQGVGAIASGMNVGIDLSMSSLRALGGVAAALLSPVLELPNAFRLLSSAVSAVAAPMEAIGTIAADAIVLPFQLMTDAVLAFEIPLRAMVLVSTAAQAAVYLLAAPFRVLATAIDVARFAANAIVDGLDFVLTAAETMSDGVFQIVGIVGQLSNAALALVPAFAGAFGGIIAGAIETAGILLPIAVPLLAIYAAIGLVLEIWAEYEGKVSSAADSVVANIGSIANSAGDLASTVRDDVSTAIGDAVSAVGNLERVALTVWSGMKGAATTAWNAVGAAAGFVMQYISDTLGDMKSLALDVWNTIKTVVSNTSTIGQAWDALKAGAGAIAAEWDIAKTRIYGVWLELKSEATTIFYEIAGEIQKATMRAASVFNAIWTLATREVQKMFVSLGAIQDELEVSLGVKLKLLTPIQDRISETPLRQ